MAELTDEEYLDLMREILLAEPIRGVPTQPARLLDHMFIGSQSNAESLRLLRSLNITHVLNCAGYKGPRPSPDASPYEGLGIDYYEFQAEDTDRYDICQHFPEAFAYLDKVHRQGGVALVHCALGINRSAAVCLGYMMTYAHMPLLEATRVIKDRRRVVLANKHFQKLLVKFAKNRGLLDNHIRLPDNNHHKSPTLNNNNNNSVYRPSSYSVGSDVVKMREPSDYRNMRAEYDTPTFSTEDPIFSSASARYGANLSGSNGYPISNGTRNGSITNGYDVTQNGVGGGGKGGGGGKMNGIYRDLFDRFDRLTESFRSASKAVGLRNGSNSLDDDSSFRSRAASSSSLQPDWSARVATGYQPRWAGTSGASSASVRSGSATPRPGSVTPRPGSVTPRPGSALERHNSMSGYRSSTRSSSSTPRPLYKPRPLSYIAGVV